ncbi:hypothetical protein K4G89_21560, partial [Mycobacterium tuberculosis]|nr:hypothetical protein [Mycobacterium tuberculosis]
DTIICNYPNGDMVGHTGVMEAAVKAVEALDRCIDQVAQAVESVGGQLLITADHGNAEQMRDPATGQAHTARTVALMQICIYRRTDRARSRRWAFRYANFDGFARKKVV